MSPGGGNTYHFTPHFRCHPQKSRKSGVSTTYTTSGGENVVYSGVDTTLHHFLGPKKWWLNLWWKWCPHHTHHTHSRKNGHNVVFVVSTPHYTNFLVPPPKSSKKWCVSPPPFYLYHRIHETTWDYRQDYRFRSYIRGNFCFFGKIRQKIGQNPGFGTKLDPPLRLARSGYHIL